MGILRELPPTAGWPIYTRDLLALCDPKEGNASLEDDFIKYLGAEYAAITYSGTAAFYLILETLKELSSKKTVVIPSYICPLVPLAIQRAGLKVEVCDIAQDRFDFNFTQLESICSANKDILAIVPAHLAGIPIDFDPVAGIAKKFGIYTVEDCAQSLGAVYKGKFAGTLGDFSFFSLCRGKGLTIYEGGVAVANDKAHAQLLDAKIAQMVKDDFFSESLKILELFGYWIFYRPRLFWWVFRLPQIFWKARGNELMAAIEYFTEDFPIHRISRLRKAVGHVSFKRIEGEIDTQRQKALRYIQGLKTIKGLKVIEEAPYSRAAYPYLTILFEDERKKEACIRGAGVAGLGVSQIYTLAVPEYHYLKDTVPFRNCAMARTLAARHLTLSTSTFVEEKDVVELLQRLTAGLREKNP